MDDILLEPLRAFKDCYEKKFDENAQNYFDKLVEKSGMDVEENRSTVKKYKAELAIISDINKKMSQQKALRGFLIFLAIVGILAVIIGIVALVKSSIILGAILLPVGAVLAIISIVVIVTVLNKKIKHQEEEKQKHQKVADGHLKNAWQQMFALNGLFESNAPKTLIEMTVPLIKIDENFDMRRYDYLSGKYGFGDKLDNTRSTIAILTGEILGNPFVVDRELVRTMGTQ
ncbi:MAG: hypothetical protein K2M36_05010, partial [Clostridia bacterium]|nr:hypothetical protein [Clostridia bacterium]